MSERTLGAMRGLTVLRYLAAHGADELVDAKALDFRTLADAVVYAIETAPAVIAHQ